MSESFDQTRQNYLAGVEVGLEQLGICGDSLVQRVEVLAQWLQAYQQLETQHLASNWPNFPQAAIHPLRAILGELPPDPEVKVGLLEIASLRPPPNEHWEQLPCEATSARARVLAMQPYLRPGLRCLLLGDDDLLSLHLADQELELTVLDIDSQLLAFLKHHGLSGRVIQQDLDQDFAMDQYDVVVSDPPWAAGGMNAFLTVALASLKPEGHLFLSTQPVMLENRSQFESKLSRLQLENCWPNLNRYAYPDSMLQEVIFQMACWDVEPHLTRLLFGCPYLYADFMLFRRPPT